MTETVTPESTDAVVSTPDGSQPPAGRARAPRRWTFGAIVTQLLVLAVVAGVAFGAGYFSHEREQVAAMRQVMDQRLAAQERIGELEKEVLQLRIAQLEDANRRATVVEVDLGDVITHLRDRIVETAATHKAALAADASTMLTGVFSALGDGQPAPAPVPLVDTSDVEAPMPDVEDSGSPADQPEPGGQPEPVDRSAPGDQPEPVNVPEAASPDTAAPDADVPEAAGDAPDEGGAGLDIHGAPDVSGREPSVESLLQAVPILPPAVHRPVPGPSGVSQP